MNSDKPYKMMMLILFMVIASFYATAEIRQRQNVNMWGNNITNASHIFVNLTNATSIDCNQIYDPNSAGTDSDWCTDATSAGGFANNSDITVRELIIQQNITWSGNAEGNGSNITDIYCGNIKGADSDFCVDSGGASSFTNGSDITIRHANITGNVSVTGNLTVAGNTTSSWYKGFLNVSWVVDLTIFLNKYIIDTGLQRGNDTSDVSRAVNATHVLATNSTYTMQCANSTLFSGETRNYYMQGNASSDFDFLDVTDNTTLATAIKASWNYSAQIRTSLVDNDGGHLVNGTAVTHLNTTIYHNLTITNGVINLHIDAINATHFKSWIG